jgi:hypothetical protein
VADVERRPSGNTERLKIEDTGSGISQNNPRAGTSFRNCGSGSCSPGLGSELRSRSGRTSAGKRAGAWAGRRKLEISAGWPWGRPRRSTYPLSRLPAYPRTYPSRYAPVRNGLVRRSIPIVVSGPWPL